MKRYIIVCLAIGLVLALGSVAMAGTAAGTGIQYTSHDLSVADGLGGLYGATDSLDRICIYCHTPHHAMTTAAATAAGLTYYPLWNHAITTMTSYQTYTNGTDTPISLQHQFNGQDTIGQPGSVSRLCLSCHDGSVAISAYGYAPSGSISVGTTKATGRILIGGGVAGVGDLSNHHPIGFNYRDVASKDDEIRDADTTFIGNAQVLSIADLLWNDKMECSSCHDVHNTKNEGSKFTWVDDTNSAFCLTCHAK